MTKEKKRLNDIAAIAQAPCYGDTQSSSVEVRKISNGYVKRTSSYDGNNYSSSEEFSGDKPSMDAGKDNPMAKAKAYMERA